MGCNQACPYNTLNGCKVKEYNAICPLTNMASVTDHKPITNADRLRQMSDEELAKFLAERFANETCNRLCEDNLVTATQITAITHTWYCCWMDWLRRPAEGSQ